MYNLFHATITTNFLAVPHASCSTEDAYNYVDTLLDLKILIAEPCIGIQISERTPMTLSDSDLYPFREHLQKLFQSHKIIEYDVNTVGKVADQLLRISPSFEEYCKIEDVLFEHITTEPDILKFETNHRLCSDLAQCIIMIALLKKHCAQPPDYALVCRKTSKNTVKIRAIIHEIDHKRDDLDSISLAPDFFEGDLMACTDLQSLIGCLDEARLLEHASDNLGVELSMRVAVYKQALSQGEHPDWNNIKQLPKIGNDFLISCQKCCAEKGSSLSHKILRSIIETVNGHNLREVHAIRTGQGGDNPQLMRGQDKAQRRNIDREFHLHYWDCANGQIELASVVYHNDYSIPK